MSNVSKVSERANALLEGSKQYDASTQALIKNLISSMNNPTELIQSKINNIDLTDDQRIAVNKAISEGVQESLIQKTTLTIAFSKSCIKTIRDIIF